MTVLKDNRKHQAMTVAEADDLFLRIARLKAVIDKESAAHKKKLADLEMAHKEKISAALEEKETLEAQLEGYIMANQELFEKPRKHPVGQIGTYGITTDPAYVDITDEDAVIEYARENGYDELIQLKVKLDKDAVRRRIEAGETIPGADLIPAGDVVKITFKKGYAEALTEE